MKRPITLATDHHFNSPRKGARIGELLDLTISDLEDHKHGKKIVIQEKTITKEIPTLKLKITNRFFWARTGTDLRCLPDSP